LDPVRNVETHRHVKIQERNDKLHLALDVGLIIGAVLVVLNVIADGIIFYGIHCAVFYLNNIFLSSMFALSVPVLVIALCDIVILVAIIDMAGIIYLNFKE